MELLLGFVVAVGVTMALIPPLIKLAPLLHFVDLPQSRKVHVAPIPRVGGIAMAAGLLLALFVSGEMSNTTRAFIAGILVLVAFGIWDDRTSLPAGPKFLGQAIAVLIVMVWGGVSISSITLVERHVMPEWLAAPLTLVFLVGATNAINLADGLDGLAGGTTLMCLAGLALLGFTVGNLVVGGIALLIVGVVLGFLRYNTYPARVFMGDTGSQLLGYCAAVLAVMLTQDVTAPLSSALPLLLLGVPIIDTFAVMTGRILAGQSPFKADRNHTHHRLLALGFDHHEAVMVIYLVQAACFVTAWYMRYETDIAIAIAFAGFAAAILLPLHYAKLYGWRLRHVVSGVRRTSPLRRRIEWLAAPARLPRWSYHVIAVAVACYAITTLATGARPPKDAAILACIAAVTLAVNIAIRWRQSEIGWIDKATMYLCTVLLVFLNQFTSGEHTSLRALSWVAIIAIALAVAVRLRLSPDRRFAVTPLDVLVVIAAIAIPNLPGSIASPQALGAGIAELVVLFYGIETLSVVIGGRWKWLSCAALASLIVCASKGISAQLL